MTQEPMDDVLKALREELAAVSPSPEFQARVRQRVNGEIDLLRSELAAVTPSPEFAVRVRQGIEDAQAARAAAWWRLSSWRWIVPAAAAAAIVALMVMLRPQTPPVEQVQQVTAKATPAPQVVPAPPQTIVAPQAQPRVKTPQTVANAVRAAAKPADPFSQVITNQPALLRAQRDRIRATGAPEDTTAVTIAASSADIVVAPVEVSPIVVKWMVEPPSSASGGAPIIRRVTAPEAEGSAK